MLRAHVLGCVLAAAAAMLGCGLQAEDSASARDARGAASAGPDGDASVAEGAAKRIYYQYVDERGRVRFVPTLAAVPQEWRSRVGFVQMDGPPPGSPGEARRIRDRRTARGPASSARSGFAASAPSARAALIMYSADWCGVCTRAKRYMDRKGIAYDERDVDDPSIKREMVEKAGPGGIPVFDADGQILRGFSEGSLDRLLES